jgi:DNA-binding transcriptional MerR regulator
MTENYLTCGQVARKLRVSISTLKRWVEEPGINIPDLRNHNSWRLFTEDHVTALLDFKKNLKRNGKRFKRSTLQPIIAGGKTSRN